LSIGFKNSVSFLLAIQATRLLTFCLGGTKDYFPLNTPALAGRTLRPGTSPHALRIPPRDGHPALRSSNFALRPASRYSRFWIWCPSSEHQRDFNPPEQCAAQRTICPLLTSDPRSDCLATVSVAETTRSRSPGVSSIAFCAQSPDLRSAYLMDMGFAVSCPLALRSRLVSGSCPSTRAFAPRFFQTPPHGDSPCVIANPYLHQVG
jgi:hypothetical protein